MSWLLDTHVWIWSQMDPGRLGSQTTAVLASSTTVVYVATVSTLELARLVSTQRLDLRVSVDQWVEAALKAMPAITIELSHVIAAEAYRLPEPFHRDPADRILVATARHHGLDLMTADRRILDYRHIRTHDATM